MDTYILRFQQIDNTMVMLAGGKGASVGELSRMGGIAVPEGFCLSTLAYKKITENNQELNNLLEELTQLKPEAGRERISAISAKIRLAIERIPVARDIAREITAWLKSYGENDAFAIRSSATAEDLPSASFAGQQDTFLNIIGPEAILKHISRCWASLFTERAVIYRLKNGFDHRNVRLAVLVQKMIFPQSAGVLFTADPLTSNRKISSIDASFGLGEAAVSGIVSADTYKTRNGKLIARQISTKKLAIYALKDGGTFAQAIEPERQNSQVLSEQQILQLERTGRMIEKHFGRPQDIEWCRAGGVFYFLQSRPITTLYPIPEADDSQNHVYISVGHQQMMTDAFKPLGLSLFQLTAFRPMFEAGGRLFVDVSSQLASPLTRKTLIDVMGEHDPLIKDALMNIIERGDFIKSTPNGPGNPAWVKSSRGKSPAEILGQIKNERVIVAELIRQSQTSIKALEQTLAGKSGSEVFDLILQDIQQLKTSLRASQNMGAISTAIDACSWINENMVAWLGEKNAADTLSQSAPNNVTSEMGRALLNLADAIRPYPEVIEYLQGVKDDHFLEQLDKFDGGVETRYAINAYLSKYGMRCAGEIDISKTRWSENPSALLPAILSNIRNFEPGAGAGKFEQGLREALAKEKELLHRLRQLPQGEEKARDTKQMISMFRNLIGYREYPKFAIINRYWVYKQALIGQAEQLVRAGLIEETQDIYYLTFEEFRQAAGTVKLDYQLIVGRKAEYENYKNLHPPRVITSEGEIIEGKYNPENLPRQAIAGLAVSRGVVEGRARVIVTMEDADLEVGDILVTTFTDPSWTPLFLSVKALVTEVGGLMTHGAVIAREYGLPAVVGVQNATKLIRDGQRIRVNGTEGYVEIL